MLEKDTAGSDVGDRPRQLPKRVRRGEDVHAAGRQLFPGPGPGCLSVGVHHVLRGFLPEAFTRGLIWMSCGSRDAGKKSRFSAGEQYSNQAFYDEIEGAITSLQQPRMDPAQTFHHLNLYENQAPRRRVATKDGGTEQKEAGGRQDPGTHVGNPPLGRGSGEGYGASKSQCSPARSLRFKYHAPNSSADGTTSTGMMFREKATMTLWPGKFPSVSVQWASLQWLPEYQTALAQSVRIPMN